MLRPIALAVLSTFATSAVAAPAAPALADTVRARIGGDRSGACLAVALIEGDRVHRAYECADAKRARALDARSAFEIGSVTKPMVAALLAQFIAEGRASLDDPLARHLPAGTAVPTFEGRPILLRHVVTHTSGLPALPPGMAPTNAADPYAGLAPAALLEALGRTRLPRAPGERYEYSNFAMMLLSQVVARLAGTDLESALASRLFAPIGMRGAHVATLPDGVRAVQGHLSTGEPTAPWTFDRDLAGVGGVRATLDDMVRYVQAHVSGTGDARVDAALARTLQPLTTAPPMGMNWMLQPWKGATLVAHEGGTGGFSSLVAFVPAQKRGVVILSDTSLNATGSLGPLGMHLLDPTQPAPKPRRRIDAPAALLAALEGEYVLDGGLAIRLWQKDGALWAQATGQPAFELRHDDAGDFYPTSFDALLTPQRQPDGRHAFVLRQGGGAIPARRVDAGTPAASPASRSARVDAATLRAYVGTYPLVPGFALTVVDRDGRLRVQGTGQPEIEVEATGPDTFVATVVGAELRFVRDAAGKVVALELRQAGQVLRGDRAP